MTIQPLILAAGKGKRKSDQKDARQNDRWNCIRNTRYSCGYRERVRQENDLAVVAVAAAGPEPGAEQLDRARVLLARDQVLYRVFLRSAEPLEHHGSLDSDRARGASP